MNIPEYKRVIYVAGAYSGLNVLDVLDNMRIGIDESAYLFKLGFSPFCPWLDFQYCLAERGLSIDQFYQYSTDFLKRCDAVLVVDNPRNSDSKGLADEIRIATSEDIPVFVTRQSLLEWASCE